MLRSPKWATIDETPLEGRTLLAAPSKKIRNQYGGKLTLGCDTALSVRFLFCSHHIQNTGWLFPRQERNRTTRRRQVTEDVSELTCGRKLLDSIWSSREGRHKSGASSSKTNLVSQTSCQLTTARNVPDFNRYFRETWMCHPSTGSECHNGLGHLHRASKAGAPANGSTRGRASTNGWRSDSSEKSATEHPQLFFCVHDAHLMISGAVTN